MTRVAAVLMVRDEADVVIETITHLLEEAIDIVLVADNNSTDGTRDLLADLAREVGRVVISDDPDPAYYQSVKMSALAERAARDHGAEWVVPVDADEVWVSHEHHLGHFLRGQDPAVRVAEAALFNHFRSAADTASTNPYRSMVWRQPAAAPLAKVAFRWSPGAVIHQGNHGVDLAGPAAKIGGLEIRHFPYRSKAQFVAKAKNGAAAYAATDLPYAQGQHWRSYGDIAANHGDDALEAVFDKWFWFDSPSDAGLVHDPAPWCRWRA